MRSVRVQSPTRVDLAGGTLDLWPLSVMVPEASTLNLAIPIFTTCELRVEPGSGLDLKALGKEWTFPSLEKAVPGLSTEGGHPLLAMILEGLHQEYGFRPCKMQFHLSSESPIGGGLGGSSSLVISILRAILEAGVLSEGVLLSHPELVQMAHNLEARHLRTPTGVQDYWPALEGGCLWLKSKLLGIFPEPCSFSVSTFWQHAILVDTGRSHHSGLNNWDVYKRLLDGDGDVALALRSIAAVASQLKPQLQVFDPLQIADLLRQELQARLKLSSKVLSPEILELDRWCRDRGGVLKVCGAGGGGSVLLFFPERDAQIAAFESIPPPYRVLSDRTWKEVAPSTEWPS